MSINTTKRSDRKRGEDRLPEGLKGIFISFILSLVFRGAILLISSFIISLTPHPLGYTALLGYVSLLISSVIAGIISAAVGKGRVFATVMANSLLLSCFSLIVAIFSGEPAKTLPTSLLASVFISVISALSFEKLRGRRRRSKRR